jgi:hypothetical protein
MIQYFPIVTGSLTVNGDLIVTGTGSMSASLALNSNLLQGTGSTGFATTASLLAVSSSQQQISASLLTLTASYTALSSSYTALSGSYNTFSGSESTRITKIENNYATTGSNSFRADQSITGSLVVSSTITAQTLVVQTVTSSILYSSGSNVFGNQLANTQTFTGSVNITGSQTIFGNVGINYAPQSYIRTFIYDNSANYGLVVQQDGSGTIAQFSGNSGAVRMYISASGNVGIGVTNPTRQLFVNDTVFFDNAGNGSTTNPSIAIGSTSLGISYLGGSNMALLTGGSTKMFISASGIIGIGATIPVGKLNLVGSTAQYIVLTNTAADGVTDAIQGGIIGQSRGSANNLAQMASILFRNKATSPWYKGEITFSTNDTDGTDPSVAVIERMRITSAGNIGMGTATPNGPLDIVGTLYGGLYTLSLYDSAAVAANIGGGIYFGGNYTGTTKTGWAGILGRKDNATDGEYGGYMAFQTRTHGTAPAERMRIGSDGKVGIGTSSWHQPYTKLIVAGAIAYNNNTDDEVSDNGYGQSFAKKINIVAGSGANTIYSAAGSEAALYVVTGLNLTSGARFVDLILYLGAGSTAPVVVASQTYSTSVTRTYANSGENLTLSLTGNSNTYTIRMTGMGANERT